MGRAAGVPSGSATNCAFSKEVAFFNGPRRPKQNTEFIASYRGLTRAPCPAYFGVLVAGNRTLLQSQIRFDLRRLEVDVEVLAVPWLP